jgi:hypothetical protein
VTVLESRSDLILNSANDLAIESARVLVGEFGAIPSVALGMDLGRQEMHEPKRLAVGVGLLASALQGIAAGFVRGGPWR